MERWCQLAMSMSGSNHVIIMSRGAYIEYEKNIGDMFRLLSLNWFSMRRLMRLMSRLYNVGLIQIIICFDRIVGPVLLE